MGKTISVYTYTAPNGEIEKLHMYTRILRQMANSLNLTEI